MRIPNEDGEIGYSTGQKNNKDEDAKLWKEVSRHRKKENLSIRYQSTKGQYKTRTRTMNNKYLCINQVDS